MKQLRKIASLMCVLALMAMAVSLPTLAEETPGSVFTGGTGTAEDPWLIETAEQLNAVRNDLDGIRVCHRRLHGVRRNDGRDHSRRNRRTRGRLHISRLLV